MTMQKRQIIEAYYNVDGKHWSTANGSFALPSMIPCFGLYAKVAIKLHLISNYGLPVTDHTLGQGKTFTVYSEEGVKLCESLTESINNADGLALWNADATKGEFIILLDCATVPLQTLLADQKTARVRCEFIVIDEIGVVGEYKEYAYCEKTFYTADATTIPITAAMTQGSIDIDSDSVFSIVPANTVTHNILSPFIMSPTGAEINYSVTNVEVISEGFKVYYNATIVVAGYTLHYTLIRKG